MIDLLAKAFEGGNRGLTIWPTEGGFQVNIKRTNGAFNVTIAPSLQEALQKAFGSDEEDLL